MNIFSQTDFIYRQGRPALSVQTHDDEVTSSGDESDNDDLSETNGWTSDDTSDEADGTHINLCDFRVTYACSF